MNLGFLSFVVASIVAMVFLRRICSSHPGDGEQRGQSLAALTAHGRGLYCLQPQPRLPTARFLLAGSLLLPGPRARRALFPTCGVVRVAGYSVVWDCDPTPRIFLKSTKRSAAAIFRSQRSFITFHGALRNILLPAGFPVTIHMIALEQTFVNDSLQKIFSC